MTAPAAAPPAPLTAPPEPEPGPLLHGLLAAQRRDADSATQVRLRRAAHALAEYARALGRPPLEPVSPAGHRLAGAALLLAGDLALRRDDEPPPARLLLVEGVTLSSAALEARAHQLRSAGAGSVYAFVGDEQDPRLAPRLLDGWQSLPA